MEPEENKKLNENIKDEEAEKSTPQVKIEEDIVIEEIEEAEEDEDKIGLMGDYIRQNSRESKIVNAEDLLEEPFSFEVDELLLSIDELKEREEFKDIYTIKGSEVIYLFSDKYITYNYAKMMVMVEEKDLLKLVVETVRHESKTYPRPTDSRLFSYNPFKLSKEELDNVIKLLKTREEYSDIKKTETSNKALYLYSDKFMTKAHAFSLAEWSEVGSKQNP